MFKKYLKKLIRQVQNESIEKSVGLTDYNTNRINEIEQKILAIQQHLNIYVEKNYGYSVQEVPKGLSITSLTQTPCNQIGKSNKKHGR